MEIKTREYTINLPHVCYSRLIMKAGPKKSAYNLKSARLPTTGYERALKFMFIRRELGGKGTGCLFQFTYCV